LRAEPLERMNTMNGKELPKRSEIKVVICGVGEIGGRIAKLLLKKKGIRVVGAIDMSPRKVGKDLAELLGLEEPTGVTVSKDAAKVISETKPDIVVHATTSFLKDAYSQILTAVEHGANVVSTTEELSYPYIVDPKLAEKLDSAAKEHGVTVLGTGINPGFLMDTLAITLTAVCQEVYGIEVKRVMNAATRRVPFQKKIGAGLTVEEFTEKIRTGAITGHVGLEQSIAMIAAALGWKLDKIDVEPVKPVVATKRVESQAVKVEAGRVAGLRQQAHGIMDGEKVITLDFQAYIGAEEEYDSVTIKGVPEVHEKISPCVHGDLGTVAVIVNMIPKVIAASPGLKTMKDLPVPSATPEDMRTYLER